MKNQLNKIREKKIKIYIKLINETINRKK